MTAPSSTRLTLPVTDRDHIQGSPEGAVSLVVFEFSCAQPTRKPPAKSARECSFCWLSSATRLGRLLGYTAIRVRTTRSRRSQAEVSPGFFTKRHATCIEPR